jgi:hypothetical protein
MAYVLQPTMTDARVAWLEKLTQGPAYRARTAVGAQCMQLGWVEWNYLDGETRQPISEDEARARYGQRWWDCVRCEGERITVMGRQALADHRDRMAKL